MRYEGQIAETVMMRGHQGDLQDGGRPRAAREDLRVSHLGHAFFAVDRPLYRQHAAVDGWQKVLTWFGKHLA